MGEEAIKKILNDFGLTGKESDVYIFLSKHGILKCAEIAKEMKRHKAQIYRILKILENKGLVEATLEAPTRFIPVPFEKALDLTIKAKHDEAVLMEKTREEVTTYWKNIRQTALAPLLQRFVVLEGNRKIFPKISQLIKDAERDVSFIITFPDLVRADNYGVLDITASHSSKIRFRFLTDISNQDVITVKNFLKTTQRRGFEFKVRNPDLGPQSSPRIIIKDSDEMLFFITKKDNLAAYPDEVCLWTNCKELVQSFFAVFNDSWQNSADVKLKIAEIETGQPTGQTYTIGCGKTAKKKYEEILQNAKDEIVFVTSAEGLSDLSREKLHLLKWAREGVLVRIMAPIVKENFEAAKHLSESCFVKHTPRTYTDSTLVDSTHLFQFKRQPLNHERVTLSDFENTFYTTDEEYIERAKNTVNYIWKNAHEISDIKVVVSLEEFLFSTPPRFPIKDNQYTKLMGWIAYAKHEVISEKEVISKFTNAKKVPVKDPLNDIVRYYGSRALAVIPRSETFDLPDLVMMPFCWNEYSSFGAENRLIIYAKVDYANASSFLPVATVGDNDDGMAYMRLTQKGTPSAKTQTVGKDELKVQLQSNTLFVGWTVPINLNLSGLMLAPGCIIFEAYGNDRAIMFKSKSPSGRLQVSTNIFSEASVTFFNSQSQSSGTGTDAFLVKRDILTAYPPRYEKK